MGTLAQPVLAITSGILFSVNLALTRPSLRAFLSSTLLWWRGATLWLSGGRSFRSVESESYLLNHEGRLGWAGFPHVRLHDVF